MKHKWLSHYLGSGGVTQAHVDAYESLNKLSLDDANRVSASVLRGKWMDAIEAGGDKFTKGTPTLAKLWKARIGWADQMQPDWIDHPEILLTPHGKLFVSHNYALADSDLRKMLDYAQEHGLTFEIDGRSWYFSGETVRVTWRKNK